jgi:hypothetical protein
MNKSVLIIFALLSFAVCEAQQPEVIESPVNNPELQELKGPEFKNNWNRFQAEHKVTVTSGQDDGTKGPEYKNKRSFKGTGSKVVVRSTELKGPEYKNKRF